MQTVEQIAIEALRAVAQEHMIDAAGIFVAAALRSPSNRAVMHALQKAGQVQRLEHHESYSGRRQTVWQGEQLLDCWRPAQFDDA